MAPSLEKWEKRDFGQAMVNAVYRHAPSQNVRYLGNKLTFNGFWRDGKKRNVCIWPEEGTWSDLNISNETGSYENKGGVKSFAKTVFNLELRDFMQQYGDTPIIPVVPRKEVRQFSTNYVNNIWTKLLSRDRNRINHAGIWLSKQRKMPNAKGLLGCAFANLYPEDLELFDEDHKSLIRSRVELGHHIVVPLRGTSNEKVENLLFRCIDDVAKSEKARLLTNCGGWSSADGAPRAFGYPHAIHDFERLILCEGMADYFAAECLLDACEKTIPIGTPGVAAFDAWVSWLASEKYPGEIIILYQLDPDKNGRLEKYGTGQRAAVKARKTLCDNKLNAKLFNWAHFIEGISDWGRAPQDIADSFLCTHFDPTLLSHIFHESLRTQNGKV